MGSVAQESLVNALNSLKEDEDFKNKFLALMEVLHLTALRKGWYNPAKTFGEQVVMMHSELSEVIEAYRGQEGNVHEVGHSHPTTLDIDEEGKLVTNVELQKPEGVPIEFADLTIRVFDTCAYYDIDLFDAIFQKALYNLNRSIRHGGKKL